MDHDAIEKHVNKRLEYSSATIFLIPNGHKIVQKSVQMNLLLRGDVTKRKKRTTGPEAWVYLWLKFCFRVYITNFYQKGFTCIK